MLSNIEKDRLDAQLLRMKIFVLLTDLKSSCLENAYLSSLCVLGSPMNHTASLDISYSSSHLHCGVEEGDKGKIEGTLSTSTITRIHEQIQWIIMQLVDDTENGDSIDNYQSHSSYTDDTITSTSSSCVTTMSCRVVLNFASLYIAWQS